MKEMIRRHQLHMRRSKNAEEKHESDSHSDEDSKDDAGENSGVDADRDGDELATTFVHGDDDDPNSERVNIIREPRPSAGDHQGEQGDASSWDHRTPVEHLSAAGAAKPAGDRVVGSVDRDKVGTSDDRYLGLLFNPKNYPWLDEQCNVHYGEEARLKALVEQWYGKAFVGDGADVVERDELDAMQKFAHDIVLDDGKKRMGKPLRMMLLGTAGTGKSRTVRSFVHSRRRLEEEGFAEQLRVAELALKVAAEKSEAMAASRREASVLTS